MLDWFKVNNIVMSVSFSPKGEFLATVHQDKLGIFLWSNNAHFNSLFLKPPPATPEFVPLPQSTKDIYQEQSHNSSSLDLGDKDTTENALEDTLGSSLPEISNSDHNSIEKLNSELPTFKKLVSFSSAPRSKFKTLLHLDIIKQRNKPKENTLNINQHQTPFLLPTLSGIDPKFITSESDQSTSRVSSESKILSFGFTKTITPFMKCLLACRKIGDYTDALHFLPKLSASAIDLEIHELQGIDDVEILIEFLEFSINETQNFEIIQTILFLLLKIHSDTILSSPYLLLRLEELKESQQFIWGRMEGMMQYNQCLVTYLSGVQF